MIRCFLISHKFITGLVLSFVIIQLFILYLILDISIFYFGLVALSNHRSLTSNHVRTLPWHTPIKLSRESIISSLYAVVVYLIRRLSCQIYQLLLYYFNFFLLNCMFGLESNRKDICNITCILVLASKRVFSKNRFCLYLY